MQPYEIFTLSVRGKYFFDPYFGGALCREGEIRSIQLRLSAFTFGGVPRRFSPINIDATYRPRKTVFVNTRMDIGVQGGGLRDISATVGYDRKLLKLYQTFYYTRAVTLIPSLQRFSNAFGKEAGTLRGSQWSPAIFVGNRADGLYGGTSYFWILKTAASKQFYTFDQLTLHTRLRLRMLRDHRPIFHIQRRR